MFLEMPSSWYKYIFCWHYFVEHLTLQMCKCVLNFIRCCFNRFCITVVKCITNEYKMFLKPNFRSFGDTCRQSHRYNTKEKAVCQMWLHLTELLKLIWLCEQFAVGIACIIHIVLLIMNDRNYLITISPSP